MRGRSGDDGIGKPCSTVQTNAKQHKHNFLRMIVVFAACSRTEAKRGKMIWNALSRRRVRVRAPISPPNPIQTVAGAQKSKGYVRDIEKASLKRISQGSSISISIAIIRWKVSPQRSPQSNKPRLSSGVHRGSSTTARAAREVVQTPGEC